MAKSKYTQVGYVAKGRDGKPDYIKITAENVTLKKGEFLNLESKTAKTNSITKAMTEGKMSEETGNKLLKNLENWADWKRFDVVHVSTE